MAQCWQEDTDPFKCQQEGMSAKEELVGSLVKENNINISGPASKACHPHMENAVESAPPWAPPAHADFPALSARQPAAAPGALYQVDGRTDHPQGNHVTRTAHGESPQALHWGRLPAGGLTSQRFHRAGTLQDGKLKGNPPGLCATLHTLATSHTLLLPSDSLYSFSPSTSILFPNHEDCSHHTAAPVIRLPKERTRWLMKTPLRNPNIRKKVYLEATTAKAELNCLSDTAVCKMRGSALYRQTAA
ncbi:hypothetical protein JZ751_008858, partial [Albula glossodonta]